MKKALLFILFFIVLVLTVGVLVVSDDSMRIMPIIELNGNETVDVEVFGVYEEQGCTAKEGNKIIGYEIIEYESIGEIDTSKKGNYVVTYTAKGKNADATIKRQINVVDTTAPIITAPKEITAFKGATVFTFDYSAIDNYDGDLSKELITTTLEADVINLTVKDSSGNVGTASVKVNFVDDVTAPVISLTGFDPCFVRIGEEFVEPGYSANDNCDGNVTSSVKVSGKVDTSKLGTYQLTYTVKDKAGNKSTAKRMVTVYDNPNTSNPKGSVIYLTFDDGPGKYTDKLLGILSKYGVKATFFVTNQFPKYQNLIGKAYSQGHAIGVHTYTHQWSIYSSKKAFFDDFTKMNNLIKDQTGEYSKIYRFPGGASNVVSKQYCKGIMTALYKDMNSLGYLGYDWNVDCADTVHRTSNQVFNQVKKDLKKGQSNIILMHDIKSQTVNAVPKIIEYSLSQGYTFAVIDENTPEYIRGIKN